MTGYEDYLEEQWSARLAELQAWRSQHDSWPSGHAPDRVERSLGTWLGNQRAGRHLTAQRRSRLDAACPGWDSIIRHRSGSHSFSDTLNELVAWRAAHDRAWPSANSDDVVERSLGHWLENQRRRTERGSARDLELEECLPGWRGTYGRTWEIRLADLIYWRALHDQRWPSSKAKDPDERTLGSWLYDQRHRGTAEHEAILDLVLPGWRSSREAAWHATLDRVTTWRKRHHRLPATSSDDPEERQLGIWISTQRAHASPARRALLDAHLPGWAAPRARARRP